MKSIENLIADASERRNRKSEKEKLVLTFLRQHIWSTQSILQDVMHLQSRQSAHKTLSHMQHEGLVRSHQYSALGGKLTLWGITAHGQMMSFNPKNEQVLTGYFNPGRFSEQTIRHELDLQKLRVIAESNCWFGWTDGNRLGQLPTEAKRPDAIAQTAKGTIVAVECERTFKTLKRYEQILISYLKLLKAGQIHKVVWVLPTQDMADRMHHLITNIKSVKIANQIVQIDPAKHHINIHFCSYAKWPNYEG